MKFIVTGGAGFIGHNVVQQLESAGHECVIFDIMTDYGYLPKSEIEFLISERSKKIKANITDIDLTNDMATRHCFQKYAQDIDAVIHLASFPRQKVVNQNPVVGSDVMCTALVRLMELTKKHNIPKFVYISSSMVYGDFHNNVQENAVCRPQGQYAIMKYMGEKLVQDYTDRGAFDHVIIRPSAVYGELDVVDRVVSKFFLNAMRNVPIKVNGASEILDFTHVTDAAQGIVLAATKSEANNKTFNITYSGDHAYTLLEAAQLVVDIVGQGNIEIQDREIGFPSRGLLSVVNARQTLGFQPKIDITTGFASYYTWLCQTLNANKH